MHPRLHHTTQNTQHTTRQHKGRNTTALQPTSHHSAANSTENSGESLLALPHLLSHHGTYQEARSNGEIKKSNCMLDEILCYSDVLVSVIIFFSFFIYIF